MDQLIPKGFFDRTLNTLPQFKLSSDDKNWYIEVTAQGLTKKNVKVLVNENLITISGKRCETNKRKDKNNYFEEVRSSYFSRTFTLPTNLDYNKTKCQFKDNVLKIQIPFKVNVNNKSLKSPVTSQLSKKQLT